MVSTGEKTRVRKDRAERRAEILDAASAIALERGLERITLRAVAERLDVRPGLITHYFPVAEDLVIAAFVAAASVERENLFAEGGTPLERISRFVALVDGDRTVSLARMWLNARHLVRFSPGLALALEEQESLDEGRLTALVAEAIDEGSVTPRDPRDAALRILMAVDGKGAYANDRVPYAEDVYVHFVSDLAEWALGLDRGALRL